MCFFQVRPSTTTATLTRTTPWSKLIIGQPYSKANSRQIVIVKGQTRIVKSREALRYLADFAKQCPVLDPLFEGPVHVHIEIWYESNKPDLDESLILDAMQLRIYRNDRQVKQKTVIGRVDPVQPRALIRVQALEVGAGPDDPGYDGP